MSLPKGLKLRVVGPVCPPHRAMTGGLGGFVELSGRWAGAAGVGSGAEAVSLLPEPKSAQRERATDAADRDGVSSTRITYGLTSSPASAQAVPADPVYPFRVR